MMSRCTVFTVGLGVPHQFDTAWKSTDWPGDRALILYAPVPIAVSGLVHQFCGSFETTFWSTIMPVVASSAIALRNQPAGEASLATTVVSSGADRPDMVTDGSFLASRASIVATGGGFVESLSKPAMADRLVEYGPCCAAARFHEYTTSLAVTLSPFEKVTSLRSLNV